MISLSEYELLVRMFEVLPNSLQKRFIGPDEKKRISGSVPPTENCLFSVYILYTK